jgi:hypothetical protein
MDATAAPQDESPVDPSAGLLPFSTDSGLCWYCEAVTADPRSSVELLEALLECPGPLHQPY